MLNDLKAQASYEADEMERLKAEGREKSATYRQFFGNRLFYTIKDSMAELAKNEEAFAIVAKAVKLVTNFDLKPGQGMWSMMSGMSPEHMSGMISTDLLGDKFLPSLNAQLIKIKK